MSLLLMSGSVINEAQTSRLFLLDWLLGNPDRLPCHSLNWRGNPENLRFCSGGPLAGRMVAIDAVVQRRPPGIMQVYTAGGVDPRNIDTLLDLNDLPPPHTHTHIMTPCQMVAIKCRGPAQTSRHYAGLQRGWS